MPSKVFINLKIIGKATNVKADNAQWATKVGIFEFLQLRYAIDPTVTARDTHL